MSEIRGAAHRRTAGRPHLAGTMPGTARRLPHPPAAHHQHPITHLYPAGQDVPRVAVRQHDSSCRPGQVGRWHHAARGSPTPTARLQRPHPRRQARLLAVKHPHPPHIVRQIRPRAAHRPRPPRLIGPEGHPHPTHRETPLRWSRTARPRARCASAEVIDALTAQEVSAEHIEWARARLQSSNFKKLTTLLTELFEATGTARAALLGAQADVGRVFTGVRGPASHGARGGRSVEERYWLERALSWVARVDLLHAAGAPLSVLGERVTRKPEFVQAVRIVREL